MKPLSSTLSAKDKRTIRNIYNPAQAKADARFAKRQAILNEVPLRLTRFGVFIAGIWAGAIIAGLVFLAWTFLDMGFAYVLIAAFIVALTITGIKTKGRKQ